MKNTSRLTQGYLICLVGTILWSTTAIFIRYLTVTYDLPALVLAFWRDLTLAVTLSLVFLFFSRSRLRLPPGQVRFMLTYGLILSLFNSLWTISVVLNGAAVSTVLAYSSAAFTAVFGWRLFGEKLGPLKIVAVSLSLAGCVFISGAYDPSAWRLNPLGVITGLSSGVAFAAYSLMGKEASERSIDPWTVLLYAFGFAAILLLGYNQLTPWLPQDVSSTNLFWLGSSWAGWAVLVALAIGPTVGGYGLYTVSLNYLPASVANVIATLEPAFTGLQAFVLLGERFTPPQWFGSALIIAGVIVLRISEDRSPSAHHSHPQDQPLTAVAADMVPGDQARPAPATLAAKAVPAGLPVRAALTVPASTACLSPGSVARQSATFHTGWRYQGVILRDHHVLLILHQEHHNGRSYWLLPGGGREPGESEEACVRRELQEETCLEVSVERLLLEDQWKSEKGYQGAKTYLCRVPDGAEPAPGYEPEVEASSRYAITQVGWFDLRDESSWERKACADPITYSCLKQVQQALGYA